MRLPPKKIITPVEFEAEETKKSEFSWSPSKLACFELCPAKYGAEFYDRTVPFEQNEAAVWGERVHKAAELYMKKTPVEDTAAFEVAKPYVELLAKLPGKRLIEYQMAVSHNWKPSPWKQATGRMILDFGVINGEVLKGYDYKSGKVKEDITQMQIYAIVMAILFPELQKFEMKYIWFKERKVTGFTCTRSELKVLFSQIKQRIDKMQYAWDTECFPRKKNGLCKQYCGNLKCVNNGRR